MKISELLRGIADLIDQEKEQEPMIAVQITTPAETECSETDIDELARMRLLSGLVSNEPREYANEPQEMVGTVDNVTASGTDLNKSKNPADIRTNAPSMFPAAQWRG